MRTSAHIKWIESIVLGKQQQAQSRRARRQIVFPDDDYFSSYSMLGVPCKTAQNSEGVCQRYRECPNVNMSALLLVKFCRHGLDPIVCCGKTVEEEKFSMKKCVSYWKQYKRREEDEYEGIPSEGRPVQEGEYPHVAVVGIQRNGRYYWSCIGVLISDRFVLSSADCVKSRMQNIVRLGAVELEKGTQDISVEQIILNPGYDTAASKGNLALLKLATRVVFSDRVLPACLWPNHSTVPLKLYTLGLDDGMLNCCKLNNRKITE